MKLLLICVVYTLTGVVFASQNYPVSEGFSDSVNKQQQSEGDGWCAHRTNYSMIIKTNESIADKAVFLDFQKGKTKEECLQSCCSLNDCNLAVYENKEDRNCYLFNCGTGGKSRCHFARHEGYLIMTLKSSLQKSPLTKLKESQHEDELEGLLDRKAEKFPVHADVKPTNRPKIETTAPPHKSEDPDSGQLYAECADGLYCDDPNAICRQGVCVCKSGYNSRFQTCHDMPGPSKAQHTNRVKVNPGKVSLPGKSSAEHLPEPVMPVMTTAQSSAPTTAAPTPGWVPSQTSSTTTTPLPTSQSTTKAVVPQSQNSTAVHRGEEMNGAHDVAVEQIIIASPTDSAQGPIVALALGLAFTLMLLIFVGCRLRNVKRRIRKGRALHSNEADYLINGMYL